MNGNKQFQTLAMLIGAVLLAPASGVAQQADVPLNYGHSGTWYDPANAGQGLLMEVVPDSQMLIVSWFTYAGSQDLPTQPQGQSEQRWYFAQGSYREGDTTVELQLLRPQGGRFAISGASQFPIVGSASVSFQSCDSGQLSYAFGASGHTGQIRFARLVADQICAQFLSE